MTESPHRGDDQILPFQLDRLAVRGRLARLDAAIDRILTQHAYPAAVSGLLAEAAVLAALIGSAIQPRRRFSLQIRGGGSVRLIAADYMAPETEGGPPRLRAYADFDPQNPPPEDAREGFPLLGTGYFGVLVDQGTGQTYQGITPLEGENLSDCAETYFAQSEQVATRFAIAAAQAQNPGEAPAWRAGGLMIQHMPAPGEHVRDEIAPPSPPPGEPLPLMKADNVAALSGGLEDWRAAAFKLGTVEPHELLGPHVAPEELLVRLYHEDEPRVFPVQAVEFGCACSAEKVSAALGVYEPAEIADMILEDGLVAADCQFCGAKYRFDPQTRTAVRLS
ncbi:Hsp33 family molecular chaperone HslO [Neomegalonema sp.]|uniref:Hsp33 family molecular chaperone HslO n=1 Tax=Neomegalonema sp. TaxID=2039713 RepID=UPI00260EF961|nr:Hsp33 family molecular chaperone HslO [Neomegalonema sp.]MDD2869415.1 Hsp33 family molecular chaperone HslO [Neomegalonema sp.]